MSEEKSFTPKKLLIMIVELVLLFILAIVIVGVLQQFVLSPIRILGSSMAPTIRSAGDKVYVYRNEKNYEKGDVIVFYRPESGLNDPSLNPSSKKVTFSEFIQALPIVGKKKTAGDENSTLTNGYKAIIKRVVACPGDTVCFLDGQIYVNNVKEERFAHVWNSVNVGDNYSHTLTENEYFILGDNRGNSYDSEDYGPIDKSTIYGKVVLLVTDGKLKTDF